MGPAWMRVKIAWQRPDHTMQIVSETSRQWVARHPQAMKTRDALVSFQLLSPGVVKVSETIDGAVIRHQVVERPFDVVAEMEKAYIFFANQADVARQQISRGRSCEFNVFFREP